MPARLLWWIEGDCIVLLRQHLITGLLPISLVIVILATGCGPEESATASPPPIDSTDTRSHTLHSLIEQNGNLEKLEKAISAVDLNTTLQQEGPFTFFAPSNAALERDFPDIDEMIARGSDSLRTVLKQHLVRGTLEAHQPGDSLQMSNLEGRPLVLTQMPNRELRVNNQAIQLSQNGQNGILYVIDIVLRPAPPVESEGEPAREDAELPQPDETREDLGTPGETPAPDEPLPDLPPDN